MSKKSRKLIRSGGVEPVVEEAVAEVAPPREFFFVSDAGQLQVDEKDLHDQIKLWRHGRATRTIGEVIQDGYVAVFSLVVVGAMVFNVIRNAQIGSAACTSETCGIARLMMPTALVLACFALTLSVARLFGPVLASAAEGFWLMDAPISRRRLLRGRLVLPTVVASLVSVLFTGLVAALVGMTWWETTLWAVTAGLGSAALIAWAAAEQGLERTRLVRIVMSAFGAATLAVVLFVVAMTAGWVSPAAASGIEAAAVVVAIGAVAAIVALVVNLLVAGRRLEQIRRARLVSGGSLVSGMQGAMFALDFGLIRDILVEREAAERGHVRPAKGRWLGVWALVWRDVERLRRFPKPWIALAVTVVVPYAADSLGMAVFSPFISGLALFVALVPFLGSLRVLTRTGGLARALPFKTSTIRSAAMAVPAVLAFLWALATLPAFLGVVGAGADPLPPDGALTALVTGIAGLFGAVRWVTAKRVDFAVPMMATASGAMPPSLLFNLFRGFDVVAAVTLPVILGQSATWSLGIAGVVFVLLRGTFNMEEMKAEQEQLKRQQEAEKKGSGEKIRISRPNR